jgi:hypothetical protein
MFAASLIEVPGGGSIAAPGGREVRCSADFLAGKVADQFIHVIGGFL